MKTLLDLISIGTSTKLIIYFFSERVVGSNDTYTEIEWPDNEYIDEEPKWNCTFINYCNILF